MSSPIESSLRREKCINNNNGPGKQYIAFSIELLYTRLQANTAIVSADVQTTGTFVAEELFHSLQKYLRNYHFCTSTTVTMCIVRRQLLVEALATAISKFLFYM